MKLPVYLMVRRRKTTYFVDAFENTKVVELKKTLECLTRQLVGNMRLFRENEVWVCKNVGIFCNLFDSILCFYRAMLAQSAVMRQ